MASARTTYPDTQGGEGRAATAHPFVWVGLRDPSLRSWQPCSASSACRRR
jgi:hypothetical protein